MKKNARIQWLFFVASAEIVGILGGLLAGDMKAMYQMLQKPLFAPPGFLFGIVWPILYALMGTAAYLVFEKTKQMEKIYWIQLFLNFLWPVLFFRFSLFWVALIELVLLLLCVLLLIKEFSRVKILAGKLLMPYLVWLGYAAYLNLFIAIFNR